MSLAERVRSDRKRLRLTQREAADAAGISLATWGNIETGRLKSPGVATERSVARVLGWTQSAQIAALDDGLTRLLSEVRETDPLAYEALVLVVRRVAIGLPRNNLLRGDNERNQ